MQQELADLKDLITNYSEEFETQRRCYVEQLQASQTTQNDLR